MFFCLSSWLIKESKTLFAISFTRFCPQVHWFSFVSSAGLISHYQICFFCSPILSSYKLLASYDTPSPLCLNPHLYLQVSCLLSHLEYFTSFTDFRIFPKYYRWVVGFIVYLCCSLKGVPLPPLSSSPWTPSLVTFSVTKSSNILCFSLFCIFYIFLLQFEFFHSVLECLFVEVCHCLTTAPKTIVFFL